MSRYKHHVFSDSIANPKQFPCKSHFLKGERLAENCNKNDFFCIIICTSLQYEDGKQVYRNTVISPLQIRCKSVRKKRTSIGTLRYLPHCDY